MNTPGLTSLLIGLVALTVTACSERPTDHIAAAVEAVAQAKAGAAAFYAAEDLRRLETQVATLSASASAHDAQLFWLRDYSSIDRLAQSLTKAAIRLEQDAEEKRAAAKAEAETAVDEARAAFSQSQALIARLNTDRRLPLIRRQAADIPALAMSLVAAQQALDREDYLAAETRARAILAQVETATGHLQSVVARLDDRAGTRVAHN
ncbi:MAG: hypothetical protein U0172_09820 [Nitrospiraceae bacterium]